ncbi:hypothetical protein RDWZM_003617 [Blomia tropicalis]|uniref:Mediator of RNA polymerase II transcription subunit 1 n=1 Tax=Blomia tropicalis TaxID=40697 RepID=A0A9Q0MIP4_BLOTA|nr:hypothetical protein RDWZM_003617 [Blomia tropicalis]
MHGVVNGVSNLGSNQQQFSNGLSSNNAYVFQGFIKESQSQASTKQMNQNSSSSISMNDSTSSFLMEKLHSKSNQMKSWFELAKSVKQSVIEKRPIVSDNNDRLILQRCLDTIQNNIEVKSVQSMVERLETICRQLKLKFNNMPNSNQCFISSDMYYVEIKLNMETGQVLDCIISHQDVSVQSCPELVNVLQKGNFVEFSKHLEGLSAIYQIDNDKPIKGKAYSALRALEHDLGILAEVQKNNINDINNMIHKSPAGILEPRKGGYPMKMTFFVTPSDLSDLKAKTSFPLTVNMILERNLGYSATVYIEESPNMHKLQNESLICVKMSDGKNLPQVVAHTASNSTQLPACFVLKLSKSLPISIEQIKTISKVTGIDFPNVNQQSNLITLMANQIFTIKHIAEKTSSFYATLSDQNHCYYVNGNSVGIKGILVEKIPFTHPSNVPRILMYLRQQVLFNVIMGSIIRQLEDIESNCHIFEIAASDLNNIYVQFEHPIEQSLATMDIDLRDITNVKCRLYPNGFSSICSDDYASKTLQKTLSIPVTMRAIIIRAREVTAKLKANQKEQQPPSSSIYNSKNVTNNSNSDNSTNNKKSGDIDNKQTASSDVQMESNQIPSSHNKHNQYQSHQYSDINKSSTPSTQQIITQNKLKQNISTLNSSGNTMLMSMLSDVPHAAQGKPCKKRKRLSSAGEVVPNQKRRFEDVIPKSEPSDLDHISTKLPNSNELSSGSCISSSDDTSVDNQTYYSIKSDSSSQSSLSNVSHFDPTAISKSNSLVSSSTPNLSKLISQSGLTLTTPPKLKKSNSISGSSSTSNITLPVSTCTSPQINKNQIQFSNSLSLKYSDKIGSVSKSPKSAPISMLSNKMTDFENAAALAVAASSGGSHAIAAAAAAAVVSNYDNMTNPKRFIKQSKPKNLTTHSISSTASIQSSKSSPATVSVTSSIATSLSTSVNRPKEFKLNQQSLISPPIGNNTTSATSIKQKNLPSSVATSTVMSLSSPKQIQTSITSQPISQQSTNSLVSIPVTGTLSAAVQKNNQKATTKKSSLTAVVDRLRLNAGSESTPLPNATSAQNITINEMSSPSNINRTDGSTAKTLTSPSLGKSASEKSKYSRNIDSQFKVKQLMQDGLKMSITKTKPPNQSSPSSSVLSSASDILAKIGPSGTGLFKSSTNTKYTIPKIPKSSQAVTSSNSSTIVSTISSTITSPTHSSIISTSAVSSSPSSSSSSTSSSSKKLPNNPSKPSNLITSSNLPTSTGKTSPSPRISPKGGGGGQVKQNRNDKIFKNPEIPIPGTLTKLGQPLVGQMNSHRTNVPANIFKTNNLPFSNQSSTNWSQSANVLNEMAKISNSDLYNTNFERIGSSVGSSSDLAGKILPTSTSSTPSSPLESPSTVSDPLIIPIEAIESPSMVSEPLKCQPPLIIPTEAVERDIDIEYCNLMELS